MKKTLSAFVAASVVASMLAATASAQEAPAPRRMPRTPVSSENLVPQRDPMPASHQVQGLAAIIDGEKLRIGETDLRLFGIVPPQLSASFGPQARATLDNLANGQTVTCAIRDRDRDGRLLATCHNVAGADMALELLKRGLAVSARGSIAGTELATAYLAAEQAAQTAKIGLWSVASIAPVAVPAVAPAPKPEPVAAPVEAKKEAPVAPRTDKADTDTQIQAKIAADITSQAQARLDDAAWAQQQDDVGFFERYQILIAGFLMLTTGLGITGALWAQKRRDRTDEIRAIAAALRGELMAARGICVGRAKEIRDEAEDHAATWPRIRATLYQAYVGRLGLLGAELARHISSIYGQSGDYAALYNPTAATHDAPKKLALETLAKRIDEILPRLAQIEHTGRLPSSSTTRAAYQYAAPPTYRATPRPRTAEGASSVMPETASEPAPPQPAEEYTPPHYHAEPQAHPLSRASVAMWENVRNFLQSHRNAVAQEHEAPPAEAHGDYAAMIEADMARYQYDGNVETLDISPKKKSG